MRISIIVPFFNEADNVVPVLSEVRLYHPEAEIIAVDDGSTDSTFERICAAEGVKALRLPHNRGQSAAIHHGLSEATGDVCVLIDGDGQSSVPDIKHLLDYMPAYDLVNGCRAQCREDPWARVLASRVANLIRNAITRDGMRDTCGTPKAIKRECVAELPLFDGLHRFIPALVMASGYRAIEVPVSHRRRLHGVSKHTNWRRALRGMADLVRVRGWVVRKRKQVSAGGTRGRR
jgi:dolichol-phosphate mannosyltransferase